jgi:hypothetical protein
VRSPPAPKMIMTFGGAGWASVKSVSMSDMVGLLVLQ